MLMRRAFSSRSSSVSKTTQALATAEAGALAREFSPAERRAKRLRNVLVKQGRNCVKSIQVTEAQQAYKDLREYILVECGFELDELPGTNTVRLYTPAIINEQRTFEIECLVEYDYRDKHPDDDSMVVANNEKNSDDDDDDDGDDYEEVEEGDDSGEEEDQEEEDQEQDITRYYNVERKVENQFVFDVLIRKKALVGVAPGAVSFLAASFMLEPQLALVSARPLRDELVASYLGSSSGGSSSGRAELLRLRGVLFDEGVYDGPSFPDEEDLSQSGAKRMVSVPLARGIRTFLTHAGLDVKLGKFIFMHSEVKYLREKFGAVDRLAKSVTPEE